jgi:hypothetical protein
MKGFSQLKLTKGLVVLFTLGVTLILYSAFPDYYSALQVQAQLEQQQQPSPIIGIKITSPSTSQQVPVGELTISGTSTDNATSDCTVYADWNNTKPFQTATATGPRGENDYSRWTFTYTNNNHLISNGTNNLTAKLSCLGDHSNSGTANLTKFYSVNVIGISTTNNTADTTSIEDVQQESSAIKNNNTITLSNEIDSIKKISNTTDITLDNKPTTVVEEGVTANNISSRTSLPIPLFTNNSSLDRVNVNITSHKPGQKVLTGNLTIGGFSSDNVATDCTVYAGWDGQKPFQNTKALGPGGENDYSTWTFTYTPAYHAVTNKTNQLSAQISCLDDNANNNDPTAANLTKSYSVNVIGITESSAMVRSAAAEEKPNNGTNASIITSPKSIPSVSTPLPLLPSIQEQEDDKEEENEEEEEPQTESEPESEPEDDDDTTIYWDIEEDVDEDNEEVFDFEDNMFDLE